MQIEIPAKHKSIVELPCGCGILGKRLTQPIDGRRKRLTKAGALVHSQVHENECHVRSLVKLLLVGDEDSRMALRETGLHLDSSSDVDEILMG
ncbi:hypothetical protein X754_28900 [Mesorhizobium sp. LNJC403B00]|nr:hypothetical protein X754_28900 [Mesorhizobium sp. LNJC403B00]